MFEAQIAANTHTHTFLCQVTYQKPFGFYLCTNLIYLFVDTDKCVTLNYSRSSNK